ncbi:hypothetical protein SAMN02745157_0679 [Kaistia soli DSM 19436]|uniref:Uncharacterized protein n=1 Tax=Kaistia soli DSM 19436 TaxID=1122133 RepID=A0A1M4VDY8_9HYPH|nr:hypothetical protein [Kaistia soli]SHE67135.1 hypothetical protein SAMN02745157_0679 [Kaistia soli DSM 19436]
MIDFTEVIHALKAEMSASALRRQDIGAEMTRLHLENDTCLSTENEIRAALGALTRLAEKQGAATVAVTAPEAMPYEAPLQEAAAPMAGDEPLPAAPEFVPASPDDVPFAHIAEPLNRNGVIPRERSAEAIPEAKQTAAKAVATPEPAPARTAEPVAVAHIDVKPDAPAESAPMGEGRKLANRISAELSDLMREFPEGPTIRELSQWYEAPDMRVRDACRILGTDRKASLQKRKSTGFLHLLPHGARP